MTDPSADDSPSPLLDHVSALRLGITSECSIRGSDMDDPGSLDWWDEEGAPELEDEGAALSREEDLVGYDEGTSRLTVFRMHGVSIDLWHCGDVYDALDARSGDMETFAALFDGIGDYGEHALAEPFTEQTGGKVVLIDRVTLAPAWRGLGGLGRLLVGRALRWLAADAALVALTPAPTDLSRPEREDEKLWQAGVERVRRTWESIGFERFTEHIWVMRPQYRAHGEAIAELERHFRLVEPNE